MSKLMNAVMVAAVVALTPQPVLAAPNDAMACSVSVEYSLNGVVRSTYTKDFQVSAAAPFFDDFSDLLRFRFFTATVATVGGVPVVSIVYDADVDPFHTVDFGANLKVRDQSNGETTSGDNTFFTSGAAGNSAHRTTYSLTCSRAKN